MAWHSIFHAPRSLYTPLCIDNSPMLSRKLHHCALRNSYEKTQKQQEVLDFPG
jgi:hypothetical protein